jgi:putative oxidoreductase
MKALFLVGRIILGGFFVYNGINHFKQKEGMARYAASKNLPQPELAILASGALLAAGGASLILGMKPKLGALSLIGFLALASPLFHDFWNVDDPQAKQQQMVHFLKNIALLGAALSLAGVEEPWPLSLP